MKNCCIAGKTAKKCKRSDSKVFQLPRRFTKKRCLQGVRGFTMRSSCAPYKYCQKGGKKHPQAIAVLAVNDLNISGTIRLTEKRKGMDIDYDVKGLTDGKHGFHIHNYGDLSEGCTSACSHFNPYGKQHGGLTGIQRHLGDLGNIVSKNNVCKGKLFAKDICLYKNMKTSVLGRMVIIHADQDDLGLGGDEESKKTGNAGARVACGVIGLANVK